MLGAAFGLASATIVQIRTLVAVAVAVAAVAVAVAVVVGVGVGVGAGNHYLLMSFCVRTRGVPGIRVFLMLRVRLGLAL